MANVIHYKPIKPENSLQCGPHGYQQEEAYLDETLRSIDPDKDGTLKRTETNLTEDQFGKLAEKNRDFREMKGKCSVLEGQKVNYIHQRRMDVVNYLREIGFKIKCDDDGHKCVKAQIGTGNDSDQDTDPPPPKLRGVRAVWKKLNEAEIQSEYEKNPEKYQSLADAEQEIKKYLDGKEKNPEIAKSKIVAWLKNDQIRNVPVSLFLRAKLREVLKNYKYEDPNHRKGAGEIYRTLGGYYGKKQVRAIEPSSSAATGIRSLDDFDFIRKFPISHKSVRVDTTDHFSKTYRGLVEENIVLPPKISELTLSVYIKIDPTTGNIIHIGFRNIRVIGEVNKRQKQIFTLQFIELAEKILEAYRFSRGQKGEILEQVRLVR